MGLQVTLDTTELDFDRILVKQRMSNGIKAEGAGGEDLPGHVLPNSVFRFEVANVSAVPVKWRLEARREGQYKVRSFGASECVGGGQRRP